VDTLIAAGVHETNRAKRLAIYGKLLQRLALDVAYIPLVQLDQEMALAKKLKWPGYTALGSIGPWPLYVKAT
jgi:hypothetical protein